MGLSDDQKRQIYSIEAEYKTKIDDLQVQIDQLRKKERSEIVPPAAGELAASIASANSGIGFLHPKQFTTQ